MRLAGQAAESDRPVPAEKVADFGQLYSRNCSGCHGSDGKLGPAPPLNDPLFLAIVPDGELRRVIAEGRTGTPMTAFAKENGGSLTQEQVAILAHGIKPRWATTKPKGQPPSYRADAKAGDKIAGLAVFARALRNATANRATAAKPPTRCAKRRSCRSSAIKPCGAMPSRVGPISACPIMPPATIPITNP